MTNTVPMRETPDHASARVITLDEAAEMLCCSYSTALRLVTDGELRAFRVRGAWRTSTAACEEFIERGFEDQERISKSVEIS